MFVRFLLQGYLFASAALIFSGCGASSTPEGDAESGGEVDVAGASGYEEAPLGSTTSVDPFDPASCPATGMDAASARALWGITDRAHELGRYAVTYRARVRAAGEPSGWGPWRVRTGLVGQSFEMNHWIYDQPLEGRVSLTISRKGIFYLSLIDDDDRGSGVAGGTGYGHGGSFGAVGYLYLSQQNRSTGYRPVVAPLGVTFRGGMGPGCLRLFERRATELKEEEWVLFSKLTQSVAPGFQPPAGGCRVAGTALTLEGCSGSAGLSSKINACCPFGTETRFGSGCGCMVVSD